MKASMVKRILYVDDDADWRDVVTTGLSETGYEVRAVSDATEALSECEGEQFALFILDLDLAGESGLVLMNFLQLNHPNVPILLYTGMENEPEAIQKMRRQGASQYLRKGALSELAQAVRNLTS